MLGLTTIQAQALQKKYGKNELTSDKKPNFLFKIFSIICEPMFLLLIFASVIYFFLGEFRDGSIMLIFVLAIIGIDIIQEWKTDKTLTALKNLSTPSITVIRDNKETVISSFDLVPGDIMLIHEGIKIPADGRILNCNDLCIDESTLSGEAEGVWKTAVEDTSNSDNPWKINYCYAGTLILQGSATVLVEKTGSSTEYGKIGEKILLAPDELTPLQKNINSLVKSCAIISVALFILVCTITYFNLLYYPFKDRLTKSILSGITLAMAIIPEEFPVILTVFLSMGAWRLAKKHSLVRKLPSIETLGAVSVLCVDKTGTITMNQMEVQHVWSIDNDSNHLCEIMGLACESHPYDPMEKAILEYCNKNKLFKKNIFSHKLITEYPFTNDLKMMGHVWEYNNKILIAAKGAPENLLSICKLTDIQRSDIEKKIYSLSKDGLRVIAVGKMILNLDDTIPSNLMECSLTFCGLIALEDPPRKNIKKDILVCKNAGIRVIMITGDNGITAASIAKKIGIENTKGIITGDKLDTMTNDELMECIKTTSIFSRVIPEHKVRIVNAFKASGEIVAMTGDGVNDAPALKYSDIGIAMGKRGSQVCREAADLILMDDNFSTIIETIKDGRRIYDNIVKSIQYVFAIHIPIALSSLFSPLLGIPPENVFLLPLHIVMLELIIDPTCSIVLERQPPENNIMLRRPRNINKNLINFSNLFKSILQGTMIFITSFGSYYSILLKNPDNVTLARTMGLTIIILSNLFLVQVNSSYYDLIIYSIKNLAKDKIMWLITIITIIGIPLIIYTPLNNILKLSPLSVGQLSLSILISALSVLWYEMIKVLRKKFVKKF